jgi:tRNA threonylcarbamoyl adenosine modification protein (Sua5/YciO/YrdC/YwlC family)
MNTFPPDQIDAVASMLVAGAVGAIPTDTVYGLAASLSQHAAIEQLFAVKERPSTQALPILVASLAAAEDLVGVLSPAAHCVAEGFWPGPLTIVVPCQESIATLVGSDDKTVGLRVPNDDLTLKLLELTGPLAVTSANRHGEDPCHSADEVAGVLSGQFGIDVLLDGGLRDGAPSTIIRIDDSEIDELREGTISFDEIRAYVEKNLS